MTPLLAFCKQPSGAATIGMKRSREWQALRIDVYGTTLSGGGSNNNGVIFAISTTGAESVFFSMPSTVINAASRALLQARDGTIYYASAFNSTTPGGGTV